MYLNFLKEKQQTKNKKKGDFKNAMNCYLEAIDLDPESPALEAKKMLEDIFNFYNKDAYNP